MPIPRQSKMYFTTFKRDVNKQTNPDKQAMYGNRTKYEICALAFSVQTMARCRRSPWTALPTTWRSTRRNTWKWAAPSLDDPRQPCASLKTADMTSSLDPWGQRSQSRTWWPWPQPRWPLPSVMTQDGTRVTWDRMTVETAAHAGFLSTVRIAWETITVLRSFLFYEIGFFVIKRIFFSLWMLHSMKMHRKAALNDYWKKAHLCVYHFPWLILAF
jgi:hypothetical protein